MGRMAEDVTRRAALAVAGVVGLAACSKTEQGTPPKLAGKEIAKAADIPVGGGKVYSENKILVTQPVAGTYKAFSCVCTHSGCTVAEPKDGVATCPCHGSTFDVADGSAKQGPAKTPLREYPVQVQNGAVVIV